MKIALIRREYITHLDGVNRFIALLAEGLKRLGHEVGSLVGAIEVLIGRGWRSGSSIFTV